MPSVGDTEAASAQKPCKPVDLQAAEVTTSRSEESPQQVKVACVLTASVPIRNALQLSLRRSASQGSLK